MRRLCPALGVAALPAVALWAPAGAAPPATTVVRLDGIGPLHLGMTRTTALATGWLAGRRSGCPLGGTPPITYRLRGAKAPKGVRGSAGAFVRVRRGGHDVVGGFGEGGVVRIVAIPAVAVCE